MTISIDERSRSATCLSDGPDWTFELLQQYLDEIDRVAKHYRLNTYPHQIEVITSEQMMDAYSSVGMPINITPTGHLAKSLSKPSSAISTVSRGWPMRL